jgi:hypothetical protein
VAELPIQGTLADAGSRPRWYLWPENLFHGSTIVVHNGAMKKSTVVRQSVSLPSQLAKQVRNMAKKRRSSANRVLVELVEEGMAASKQKEQAFFALAEKFRSATDSKEIEKLGDELGRMVFGA